MKAYHRKKPMCFCRFEDSRSFITGSCRMPDSGSLVLKEGPLVPWIGQLNSQLTWAPGTSVAPNAEVLSPHTAKARSLLCLFNRNGGRRARAGGLLELKWLEECCKPGVSSDSAWHTAPTDISLRAVTTQAIRLEYGTAPSKVCWSYCQPGVKLSAWNTAPQDIR